MEMFYMLLGGLMVLMMIWVVGLILFVFWAAHTSRLSKDIIIADLKDKDND